MKRLAKSTPESNGCFSHVLRKFAAICEQARGDGLWVLPACRQPEKKHPAFAWKEFQQRRPSEAEIADWIECYPSRNGVYLTGPVLGRFVVDCDDAAAVAWLRRKGVPRTQQVVTARGRHVHFAYPDFRVKNSAGKIHKGVDIRGAGGIAVAVGSVHASGFRYRWARGCSPRDVKLAKAPEWLLDWLRAKREAPREEAPIVIQPRPFTGTVGPWAATVIERELAQLSEAVIGTRNNALARVAFKFGQLAAGGEADEDGLIAAVYAVAQAWPNIEKSRDTIRRSFDAGAEHPRVAPSTDLQCLRAAG